MQNQIREQNRSMEQIRVKSGEGDMERTRERDREREMTRERERLHEGSGAAVTPEPAGDALKTGSTPKKGNTYGPGDGTGHIAVGEDPPKDGTGYGAPGNR
jgi:hypothetical protein